MASHRSLPLHRGQKDAVPVDLVQRSLDGWLYGCVTLFQKQMLQLFAHRHAMTVLLAHGGAAILLPFLQAPDYCVRKQNFFSLADTGSEVFFFSMGVRRWMTK